MSHDILDSGSGTDTCGRCGGAKEPTRLNSAKCRACDKVGRAPRTPAKPVTIALPVDVWDRMNALAAADGVAIGTYLQRRVVKLDARLRKNGAIASTD